MTASPDRTSRATTGLWLTIGARVISWACLVGAGGPILLLAGAALIGASGGDGAEGGAGTTVRLGAGVLIDTALWIAAITIGALLLGWPAGRGLARLVRRGGLRAFAVVTLALLPVLLPTYALFWTWWRPAAPPSALAEWAVRTDLVASVRGAALGIGLVAWSWPLVAWCVAAARTRAGTDAETLARLDALPLPTRIRFAWRADRGALLRGAALVAFATLGATVSFDLAQVRTVGFELRSLDAQGATPVALLRAAAPLLPMALIGGICAALVAARRPERRAALATRASRPVGRTRVAWIGLAFALALAPLVPAVILGRSAFDASDASGFVRLHASSLAGSLTGSLFVALAGGAVAAALALQATATVRRVRVGALVQLGGWAACAILPAPVIAAAHVAAWNRDLVGPIVYDTSLVLLLSQLARFGVIAAGVAWFVARRESLASIGQRTLDDLDRAGFASRRRFAGRAALLSSAIIFPFALGEIALVARLAPPGVDRIAPVILNGMHYQRPDTVLFGVLLITGAGALVALALAFAVVRRTGARRAIAMRGIPGATPLLPVATVVALLPLGGCLPERPADSDTVSETSGSDDPHAEPLRVIRSIGAPGTLDGSFDYPRAMALDRSTRRLFVIDKTARVQRFTLDGTFETSWRMPESSSGRPTGISVGPDGSVIVPDTHYYRVIVYDAEGNERLRFGEYGVGPGQFVYPTDVAIGPEGRYYVSEYGSNDRIQVFDREGRYLFGFGRFGREDDAFNRPQSITFDADRSELYVADSCNHRIVVLDPDGRRLRILGGPGREPGRFLYPYGVEVLEDGTLLVSEFGNHRVQYIDPRTGVSLGSFGGEQKRSGGLRYPWDAVILDDLLVVLDSGRGRVVVAERPPIARPGDAVTTPRESPATESPVPTGATSSRPPVNSTAADAGHDLDPTTH